MGLISKIRKSLYGSAKLLGDVDAVKKGKIAQRIKNRVIGKITSRFISKK
jgi:hypothetical protein